MIKFDEWYDGLQTKITACSSEETKENNNVECYYSVGKYIKKEIEDIQEENKKYKEVLDKIKDFIEEFNKNVSYLRWNEDDYVDYIKKIEELLEEIE